MSVLETLARLEHSFRPGLVRFPPKVAVKLFSIGRTVFSERFARQHVVRRAADLRGYDRGSGLLSAPLWNAAGMFKSGEGYHVVAAQGAGAYVAGTTTSQPRAGNVRDGVKWPVTAYPRSGSASNWLGLPNPGHAAVAARLSKLDRVPGCPIGASVSADPGMAENEALPALAQGMRQYIDAGVDYIELNESCPNVPGHCHQGVALDDGLLRRLDYVTEHVLRRRERPLPVVVKFGTDTNPDQVTDLVKVLLDLGFDGIILGNTSTAYAARRSMIMPEELPVYDYFTSTFGGGLSGRVVKASSLELCIRARQALAEHGPHRPFDIIRCGGVETVDDLHESFDHGIILHQWYTGYYDAFARYGHDLYRRLFTDLDMFRITADAVRGQLIGQ